MKHIQKIAPFVAMAVGAVLALATSAFNKAPEFKVGVQTLFLYTYTGDDFSQSNIQDRDNYVRSDATCSGSTNVCGVLLPTDEGAGQHPDQTEFNNVEDDLWNAQQNPSSAAPNIVLQP